MREICLHGWHLLPSPLLLLLLLLLRLQQAEQNLHGGQAVVALLHLLLLFGRVCRYLLAQRVRLQT